jgi:hypothetical protein
MRQARQLAAQFRSQANAYDAQARSTLTSEGRAELNTLAATYRWLADMLEFNPPQWLREQDGTRLP